MIVELFYPRELKEIIADLRAKDDLNEKPLDILNNYLGLLLMVFIFFYILRPSFDHVSGHFLYLILMVVLWVLSVWITIRVHFFDKMAAYILGHKRKGAVFKKLHHWVKGFEFYKFEIVDIEAPEVLKTGKISIEHANLFPKENELIIYYYNLNKKKYKPMPDIKEIKAQYCLSKSMANE